MENVKNAQRPEPLDDEELAEVVEEYDSPGCKHPDALVGRLVTEVRRLRDGIRELLLGGEHEGECVHEGDEDYAWTGVRGPCTLHVEASSRRRAEAQRLIGQGPWLVPWASERLDAESVSYCTASSAARRTASPPFGTST